MTISESLASLVLQQPWAILSSGESTMVVGCNLNPFAIEVGERVHRAAKVENSDLGDRTVRVRAVAAMVGAEYLRSWYSAFPYDGLFDVLAEAG